MIEREWRIVCAAQAVALAAVACIAAACSVSPPPRSLVALTERIDFIVCTQERNCVCGWCPPYGNDDD